MTTNLTLFHRHPRARRGAVGVGVGSRDQRGLDGCARRTRPQGCGRGDDHLLLRPAGDRADRRAAALEGFRELRAGCAGRLTLGPMFSAGDDDPLFQCSRRWETVTPYVVTRHAKGVGAAEALAADVRAECRRIGLVEPEVEPLKVGGVPNAGLVGELRLTFKRAIQGPIVLGRTRYLGGGLFQSAQQ